MDPRRSRGARGGRGRRVLVEPVQADPQKPRRLQPVEGTSHLTAILAACDEFLANKKTKDRRTPLVKQIRDDAAANVGAPESGAGDARTKARIAATSLEQSSDDNKIKAVEAQILAIFGITVSGFSGKELAHVWRCLELVPPDHVTKLKNDSLHALIKAPMWGGDYLAREKTARIGWSLGAGFGGFKLGAHNASFLGDKAANSEESSLKDATTFDHTVLHEIGHAVDNKLKVMEAEGEQVAKGGWRNESADTLATKLIEFTRKMDDKTDRQIDLVLLKAAVLKALAKGDVASVYTDQESSAAEEEAGAAKNARLRDGESGDKAARYGRAVVAHTRDAKEIRDRLAGGKKAVTQQLVQSEAVKRATEIAKVGQDAWKKPISELQTSALNIDGRIFSLPYAGNGSYVSYAVAGRRSEVSLYQWRAPGEWFAEMYAAHFGGYLSEGHPQAEWLRQRLNDQVAQAATPGGAGGGEHQPQAPAAPPVAAPPLEPNGLVRADAVVQAIVGSPAPAGPGGDRRGGAEGGSTPQAEPPGVVPQNPEAVASMEDH